MHHDEWRMEIDITRAQLLCKRHRILGPHVEAHARIRRARAHSFDERELTFDFMPRALLRLGLGHPVGQKSIGVLATMREPQRNSGLQKQPQLLCTR